MHSHMNSAVDVVRVRSAGTHANLAMARVSPKARPRNKPLRLPACHPNSRETPHFQKDSASLNETIQLAQQGDAVAFETIYRLHSRRVYGLCLRMLGDPMEAEDLTQEAFLQLFRKIHTFRGESAFSSWLYRLTANVVLMRFRKKKPPTASLDEMNRAAGDKDRLALKLGALDIRLTGVFDRVNLQTAIEQLPAGYKSMFLLHDVHGYEHNEIARLLGCSIGNSKSQLHKARKRLRQLLHKTKHAETPQRGHSLILEPSY